MIVDSGCKCVRDKLEHHSNSEVTDNSQVVGTSCGSL